MVASLLDRILQSAAPAPDLSYRPAPHALADGLWELERRLLMPGGIPLPSRTTILRSPSGKLVVISPPRLDDDTRAQIVSLGEIGAVVAPNSFHHLFAAEFVTAFPGIDVYAAPGLPERVGTLPTALILPHASPEPWRGVIETAALSPPGAFSEVALFHRPTATLVLTDVGFNLRTSASSWHRIFWRVFGMPEGFGPSRLVRMSLLRDRAAALTFFEHVLEWPFERILVAHGDPVEANAKAALRAAYARWLPVSS